MKCNLRQPLKYKIIDTTGNKPKSKPYKAKPEIKVCLACPYERCKGNCDRMERYRKYSEENR